MDTELEDPKTPGQWHKRWKTEISIAKKRLDKWQKQAKKIVDRYLDERGGETDGESEFRLNLYTSNIQTQQATLFGQKPKVGVKRRFADAEDDVARVAGEIEERILNTDIDSDGDTSSAAVDKLLFDRLTVGFGLARVRYEAEFDTVPDVPAQMHPETGIEMAPAIPSYQQKTSEECEIDYLHWKDCLWSPARFPEELRWWGFRAELSKKELCKRFCKHDDQPGVEQKECQICSLPLNVKGGSVGDDEDKKNRDTPWDRAEVWELWDKETKKVFWYSEGANAVLDMKDDPLGLDGFFPCPVPLLANVSTSKMIPRPDYYLAQDLYRSIDQISGRIDQLQKTVRVAGVFDKSNAEIQQLLSPTGGNILYPVEGWGAFTEKGGVKGAVDWLPLEQIVAALGVLREQRQNEIDLLYQVTGWSDIMRGAMAPDRETATASGAKVKFGSVRLQKLQDEVARIASDLQRLRAEVICKHFDDETILERCNGAFSADKDLLPEAIKLLKSNRTQYRVEIKPESVSLTDFAALKQERSDVIMSISQFMAAITPLVQQQPTAMPFMLEILQWLVAGLRGSSSIEGTLDRAIKMAQQKVAEAAANPQATPPDPEQSKQLTEQMKQQGQLAMVDKETAAEATKAQIDIYREQGKQQAQMEYNIKEQRSRDALHNQQRATEAVAGNGAFHDKGGE